MESNETYTIKETERTKETKTETQEKRYLNAMIDCTEREELTKAQEIIENYYS